MSGIRPVAGFGCAAIFLCALLAAAGAWAATPAGNPGTRVLTLADMGMSEQVTLNSRPFVSGTFEAVESLGGGRNIFRLYGQVSGETLTASAELKVLRIVPFDDVPMSFWAADPIYLNAVLGIVNGYPDNTFKPEKGITRAELVTLLVKSLGTPQATLDGIGTDEVFSDVKYTHWAHKHITHGNSLRYVTGYPDGTFKPNKVLTRAEGITILARYAGLTEEANVAGAPFPDLTPGFWANKYIVPAKQAGLLNYLSGKEFEFKKEFTNRMFLFRIHLSN